MSPREYLGSLRRAWGLFRGARKTWRLPPRARLLIIDRNTAYPLDEIFAHHSPHIMDIRGESINLAVVLRALPKFRLGALAYLEAYIDAVAPMLVLSRTDNNPMLWRLKRRPSAAYTVALVQNGNRPLDQLRTCLRGVQHPLSSNHLTYLAIGNGRLVDLLRSVSPSFRVVSVGSLKLNMTSPTKSDQLLSNRAVGLISSYRAKKPHNYAPYRNAYQTLFQSVVRHGYSLRIFSSSRREDDLHKETSFFTPIAAEAGVELAMVDRQLGLLERLRSVRVVLAEDSTMGLEALAIGVRVGFLELRPNDPYIDPSMPWHFCAIGEKGPFWTNDPSEAEIERILDYLLSVSDEQWEKDSGWIRDQLIVHDHGNTILKRYVEGVLAGKGDVLAEEAGGGRG
jgi:hypothetical protein